MTDALTGLALIVAILTSVGSIIAFCGWWRYRKAAHLLAETAQPIRPPAPLQPMRPALPTVSVLMLLASAAVAEEEQHRRADERVCGGRIDGETRDKMNAISLESAVKTLHHCAVAFGVDLPVASARPWVTLVEAAVYGLRMEKRSALVPISTPRAARKGRPAGKAKVAPTELDMPKDAGLLPNLPFPDEDARNRGRQDTEG